MSEQLKPCPFCGSKLVSVWSGRLVVCHTCGCEGPVFDRKGNDTEDYVAEWNRRAEVQK